MMNIESLKIEIAAPLFENALQLALDRGVDALSARSFSKIASRSVSALNRHFGNRSNLLSAIYDRLETEIELIREARIRAIASKPNAALSIPSAMTGAIFELSTRCAQFTLLEEELEILHQRGEVDLHDAFELVRDNETRFYRTINGMLGGNISHGEIWACFGAGIIAWSKFEPDEPTRLAWIAEATFRLSERLGGRSPGNLGIRYPAALVTSAPALKDGARRIVNAAIELLGQPDRKITLREIVRCAGLSLASTTYFFNSKSEIMKAAFNELYNRAAQTAIQAHRDNFDTALVLTEEGEVPTELNAIAALSLTAGRDPTIRHLALNLRNARDRASAAFLKRNVAEDIDDLDGVIWSLSIGSLFRRALPFMTPSQRNEFLKRKNEEFTRALFGACQIKRQ